jgi:hypothetical protein
VREAVPREDQAAVPVQSVALQHQARGAFSLHIPEHCYEYNDCLKSNNTIYIYLYARLGNVNIYRVVKGNGVCVVVA